MAKADMCCKPGAPYFKTILLSDLFGIIVSVLMLLLLCMFVNAEIIPEHLVFPLAAGMAGLGALVASMAALSKIKQKRLTTGMLSGLMFFVILIILSFVSPAGVPDFKSAVVVLAAILLGSLIGIVLSGNVKQKRRR